MDVVRSIVFPTRAPFADPGPDVQEPTWTCRTPKNIPISGLLRRPSQVGL